MRYFKPPSRKIERRRFADVMQLRQAYRRGGKTARRFPPTCHCVSQWRTKKQISMWKLMRPRYRTSVAIYEDYGSQPWPLASVRSALFGQGLNPNWRPAEQEIE